ncbi:ABC transporter substrate-binding protein [Halothece sp. PCC 7418]|uniref:ABC transporter substrate-binding protein n=1 Tax=Halothece sp. (strain PCC 7418) TaxID=65093 RepID=UPI001F2B6D99|nr:ABC transporter substrate-binding protein [Halothece sp. PCC 7418]
MIVFLITVVSIPLLVTAVQSQQPTTVKVLIQALEAAQLEPIVQDFNEENPDVRLEIVEAPNDTNQVEDLYTSAFLLGDSPYDLVYMDIVWTPKFAAAGWLKDLSDRVSQEELDQFLDGDVNGGRYEDGLYRMPFRSDAGMLYYRTDWLQEAGYEPPETFTELMQISQGLQDQDYTPWGYAWQGKQYEGLSAMFVEILAGFDAFWVDPDTLEVGLDQPNAIEAVKFLRDTIDEGVSPPGVTTYSEEPTRRLFQNGETAFLRNWPYVYGLASESDIAGNFAIKPMPHAPNGRSGACQGGWGMGIAETTDHPDAAWQVVEYFSRAETQKKYSLQTGYVPSRRELFNDPELVEKYSYLPELLNVIENAVLRPPIAQYSQASDILQRYLSAAISKTMSAEEAMNAAARETRLLLKRSK